MCLAAIYWAGLTKVYYANTRADAAAVRFRDRWLYQELAKPMSRRKIPMEPLLRAEAHTVFAEWQTKSDKIEY
jgi:tRNA(Arg) A34 adenosine deaminase TadA